MNHLSTFDNAGAEIRCRTGVSTLEIKIAPVVGGFADKKEKVLAYDHRVVPALGRQWQKGAGKWNLGYAPEIFYRSSRYTATPTELKFFMPYPDDEAILDESKATGMTVLTFTRRGNVAL